MSCSCGAHVGYRAWHILLLSILKKRQIYTTINTQYKMGKTSLGLNYKRMSEALNT